MAGVNKILVVNDSMEGMQNALAKAALLEHYTGAEVEVAEVIWDHVEEEPIPEHTRASLIAAFVAAERQALRNLMEPYRDRIAWSEERVLWSKHAAEAIAEEVSQKHIDLLIKPVGVHHGLGDYLVTPLDWKILRSADCPVLISKQSDWRTGGNVLAAIDVADKAHRDLTAAVLAKAAMLADLLDAKLHVVTAYPDLQPAEEYFEAARQYADVQEELANERNAALQSLLADIPHEGVIVRSGRPVNVIKAAATELAPTVTVIGTTARHGIGKLVLGNTAEDALNQLDGDILTVRVRE